MVSKRLTFVAHHSDIGPRDRKDGGGSKGGSRHNTAIGSSRDSRVARKIWGQMFLKRRIMIKSVAIEAEIKTITLIINIQVIRRRNTTKIVKRQR